MRLKFKGSVLNASALQQRISNSLAVSKKKLFARIHEETRSKNDYACGWHCRAARTKNYKNVHDNAESIVNPSFLFLCVEFIFIPVSHSIIYLIENPPATQTLYDF